MPKATAIKTTRMMVALPADATPPFPGDVVAIIQEHETEHLLVLNVELSNAYRLGRTARYLVDSVIVPGTSTKDQRVIEVEPG